MKSELDFEEVIKEELESINEILKEVSSIGSDKAKQFSAVLYGVKDVLMNRESSKKVGDLILLLPLLYIQKKELSKS